MTTHEFWETPDCLVKTGSHLYGVAKPDSDIDYRGFVFPPIQYLIGLDKFEQKEFKKPDDTIIYSYHKFIHLLIQNNTHALEVLFAPQDMVITSSSLFKNLLAHKHLFISRDNFRSFWGFSISEWRKVKGTAIKAEKIAPNEQRIIDMIREVFKPDKVWMDEIIETLTKNHTKIEVPSTRHLGDRRKDSIEKYGYSVKNAYHAIRLLHQGIELLTNATMTFPRPEAGHLIDIRNGKFTLDELQVEYDDLMNKLITAKDQCKLQPKQDRQAINKMLIDHSLSYLKSSLQLM